MLMLKNFKIDLSELTIVLLISLILLSNQNHLTL
jgi:hypothetical protein